MLFVVYKLLIMAMSEGSHKLTFGLLASITLEVVPISAYAPFTALLLFFKCILEVMFFEGVQHGLLFCLDHLNCVKMVALQFYLQSGKQRKVARDQVRRIMWV
jgi:hypothetical protein